MPFLQTPQRLCLLEAGLLKSAGVVEVVVVVIELVAAVLEVVEGMGWSLSRSGTLSFVQKRQRMSHA